MKRPVIWIMVFAFVVYLRSTMEITQVFSDRDSAETFAQDSSADDAVARTSEGFLFADDDPTVLHVIWKGRSRVALDPDDPRAMP